MSAFDQTSAVPQLDRFPTSELRTAVARALATERAPISLLAHAGVRVAFHVEGAPDDSFVVQMDRRPCDVCDVEPAEVALHLSSVQAHEYAAGRMSLVMAIIGGEVEASGPVRRFIEVEPMLRAVIAEQAGRDPDDAGSRSLARSGPIAADLLAIETRDLHKAFGSNRILRGLNVRIPAGCISVVLGPSGTGKSVLLQHVIGLMSPDQGEVFIRGRALAGMRRQQLLDLRRDIGVMFQDGALFSALNVYDNVAFPLRQHTDFCEAEVRMVVEAHLDSVGLADAWDRLPPQLSGGMRKRAGLARALALNPSIVLCDEPDSGLDPVRTALLGDVLVEQHAEHGGTMVVVTHNIALARRIADHMSIVYRGEVLVDGMADDVLSADEPFVRQFLSGTAEGPLGMDA